MGGKLLEAVYTAVFKIWSTDNLPPVDAFIADELTAYFGSELGVLLRDKAVPFVDSAMLGGVAGNDDVDIDTPDLADASSDDESDDDADGAEMYGPAVFDPHISKR